MDPGQEPVGKQIAHRVQTKIETRADELEQVALRGHYSFFVFYSVEPPAIALNRLNDFSRTSNCSMHK